MSTIFISYRRADSHELTSQLAHVLSQRFGSENVFRDEEAIEAGAEFERVILDAIRAARVMLIVMGPSWAGDQERPKGLRRIDESEDYVRREIETAFQWNVPIIPVLTSGTSMPTKEDLPDSIQQLTGYHAHKLEPHTVVEDSKALANFLQEKHGVEAESSSVWDFAGSRWHRFLHYPFHLGQLIWRPQRFLAVRAWGRRKDGVDALIFFLVSTGIASWMVLLEWPGRSWGLFLSGSSVGVFIAGAGALPIYFSWRLIGAARERTLARVVTIWVYQSSVLHMGMGLWVWMVLFCFNMENPQHLKALREVIITHGAGDQLNHAIQSLLNIPDWVQATVFLLSMGLVSGITLWFIRSWGAYRRSLGLAWWRSIFAFGLAGFIAVVPAVLVLILGVLISIGNSS